MLNQIRLGTVLTALLLTLLPVSAAAAPGDAADRREQRATARAEKALSKAQRLFTPGGPWASQQGPRSRRTAPAPAPAKEPTLVLRDLALRLGDLDPEDRQLARSILARPTDGRRDAWPNINYEGAPRTNTCVQEGGASLNVCVHWVTAATSRHAPAEPKVDSDVDGIPDWVEENQAVFEHVWTRVVDELGYREPLDDSAAANAGPDGRTDVYLADLGEYRMYGYCTVDSVADRGAYCVIDNDFADFSGLPAENLRVTAAHEFFHAVQFAYRMDADYWLMEGTAAWVEDEVYDHINDNLQYLNRSALSYPTAPLDFVSSDDYNWVYGSWIWWRFLTEHFAVNGKRDPSVVREVWERLAIPQPRENSFVAQSKVLEARKTTFGDVFALFGAANRIAPRWYAEGRTYARFVAAPGGAWTLTTSRPELDWKSTLLDHLSTQHAVLRVGQDLVGPWRLRIWLDLPPLKRGSQANLLVHRPDGSVSWRRVPLDEEGDSRLGVVFDLEATSHVTLVLTNASTRFAACGSGTTWSCGGTPVDDGLRFAFRARLVG